MTVVRTAFGHHATTLGQDLALLLGRVVLGVVLIAHGWQKLDEQGLSGTAAGFEGLGIPAPEVAAGFAIAVELGGGVLLLLGLLTPVVGLLVLATMAGALWFVHRDGGVFAAEGGWELVGVIGILGLVLAGTGAGRFSLDRLLMSRTVGEPIVPGTSTAPSRAQDAALSR